MKESMGKTETTRKPAAMFLLYGILPFLLGHSAVAENLPNESKAPAPLARMSAVAAAAAGKLYFIGGITKVGSITDAVHEFDPVQNRWSTKASMPAPRASAAAVSLNEVVYVLGGRRGNDVLSTVEKYDPASNSWSKCAPMPTARWHPMGASVGVKIYVFGGIAGVGNARRVLDVVEVYDPAQDRWSSLPAMPIGNSNAGAAVVDSKIYLVGGRVRAGADAFGSATTKVYVYDTATGQWGTGPSMNEDRTGLEACAIDGTIYAIGGASRGSNSASVELLRPGQNKWTVVPALQKPRTDHNCAVVGRKIYVVGGASTDSLDGIEGTIEELSPLASK